MGKITFQECAECQEIIKKVREHNLKTGENAKIGSRYGHALSWLGDCSKAWADRFKSRR